MPEANPQAQHARISLRGGINSYLRGRGSIFLVSIRSAHSAQVVAIHPSPVPLNQASSPPKTHHTASVQQPISTNFRHSRIPHLGETLRYHPFL